MIPLLPSKTSHPSTAYPFYNLLFLDKAAEEIMEAGKIGMTGSITPKGIAEAESISFEIDEISLAAIEDLVAKVIPLAGRSLTAPLGPLNIETSILEIAKATDNAMRQSLNCRLKLDLVGKAVIKIAKSTILRVYNEWMRNAHFTKTICNVVNPIFEALLESEPNDYDLQLKPIYLEEGQELSDLKDLTSLELFNKFKAMVDKGIVQLFVNKLNKNLISHDALKAELIKTKAYASKLPHTAYLAQVFQEHDFVQMNMLHLLIKTKAFEGAANVCDLENEHCFFLRSLLGNDESFDFFYLIKGFRNTAAMKSLRIEVPLNKNGNPIYLESSRGKTEIMQGVIDLSLLNRSARPKDPYDSSDFPEFMSHLTNGGRSYPVGELSNCLTALFKTLAEKEIALSELLSPLLIARAVHHHRDKPRYLVALMFNTSAIIFWKNPDALSEIKKMWHKIFQKIDYLEDQYPDQPRDPLIEQIQNLMRDPEFSFADLYSMMQINFSLCLHSSAKNMSNYMCEPTQTEEQVFIQLELPKIEDENRKFLDGDKIGEGENKKTRFNLCTLIMPYDMPKAVKAFAETLKKNPKALSLLRYILPLLTGQQPSVYQLEKSHLQKFSWDPRLQLPECQQAALELLQIKTEESWKLGYALCLSLQAQRSDKDFLKEVFKGLVEMLLEPWASEIFKNESFNLFHTLVAGSELDLSLSQTQVWDKPTIALYLLKARKAFYLSLFWDYLLEFDQLTSKDLIPVYTMLLRHCSKEFIKSKGDPFYFKLLQQLLERIELSNRFSQDIQMKWIMMLYGNEKARAVAEFEEYLFDATRELLKNVKCCHKTFCSKVRVELPRFALLILQNKARLLKPIEGWFFAHDMMRLKIDSADKELFIPLLQPIIQCIEQLPEAETSAFIKSYNLLSLSESLMRKSFPLVKATLEQHLLLVPKVDIKVIIELLREFIRFKLSDDEREFFWTSIQRVLADHPPMAAMEALNVLPGHFNALAEAEALLDQFHHAQMTPKQLLPLLNFYFNKLETDASLVNDKLLKLIFDILTFHPITEESHYQKCSTLFLKMFFERKDIISTLPLEGYLQKLCDLLLWKEITEFLKLEVEMPKLHNDNEMAWLDIYATLFKEREFLSCFLLLQNQNILSRIPVSKNNSEWVKLSEIMLLRSTGLAKEWNEDRPKELENIFKLCNQLLKYCRMSNASNWVWYFDTASLYGHQCVLEELMELLLGPKASLPLKDNERLLCWMLVLKSLTKYNSTVFNNIRTWMPSVWNEFRALCEDDNEHLLQLFNFLVEGVTQVLKPLTEEVKKKRDTNELRSLARSFVKIYNSREIEPFHQEIKETEALVGLSFILRASMQAAWKASSIFYLIKYLKFERHHSETLAKAIEIANWFIRQNVKDLNSEEIIDTLILIQQIQKSSCWALVDHLSVLRYLKIINTNLQKANNERNHGFVNLDLIGDSLIGILKRPLKDDEEPSSDLKEIVLWSFNEMFCSQCFPAIKVIDTCFKNPNIERYIAKHKIIEFLGIRNGIELNSFQIKRLEFLENIENKKAAENNAATIQACLIKYGLFSPDEVGTQQKMIKAVKVNITSTSYLKVTIILSIFFGIYYLLFNNTKSVQIASEALPFGVSRIN